MVNERKIPIEIKAISILYYISSVLSVLLGITLILGNFIRPISPATMSKTMYYFLHDTFNYIFQLSHAFFGILLEIAVTLPPIARNIIIICLGGLGLFVARGLWNARKWARVLTIILTFSGIISVIISIINGDITRNILGLVLNGIVGSYLILGNNVKQAFAQV